MKKPNVLILFTDDQRFDTIHALGNDEIHTPNMDWLVENGTSFTQAHIPCGTSGAVCMPSRAMLNTSRTLFHITGEGQNISPEHTTLGEAFIKGGYKTFGTGKWHNGPASYARSFNYGDAIFFGGMWDHWNVPYSDYDPTGKYNNEINFTSNFFYNHEPMKIHCDHFSKGLHSSELISNYAIDFINKYDEEDPFLMYVAYLAPHDPRTMPEEFKKMYDPEKIKLPKNFRKEYAIDYNVDPQRDEHLAKYPRDEKEIRENIAEYYGMISHLDYQIGRIIKSLEEKGELENTIIVLAGDNGLAIGQHGLLGKQSTYDHSVRVPLIFAGPNIPKGKISDDYCYLLDIYPTLCELTGVEIPSSVEGKSLVSTINGEEKNIRPYLYFAFCEFVRAIKNDRFKLMEYRGKTNESLLFDLKEDPYEINNLYGDSKYQDVVKELREEMFKFRDEWDDESHGFGKIYWENYRKYENK